MARPAVTTEQRIDRTADRADALVDAIRAACAVASNPASTTADVQAAWSPVAGLAGNIQRDTRLLAGLGRGG